MFIEQNKERWKENYKKKKKFKGRVEFVMACEATKYFLMEIVME